MTNRQWFRTGVVSSIFLAVCCVTPILFIAITAVGLSAVAGWLDVVLIPALVVSLGLTDLANDNELSEPERSKALILRAARLRSMAHELDVAART